MKVAFRHFGSEPLRPAADEILIASSSADRCVAARVFAEGLTALVAGDAPVRVVLPGDPTLDDALAATFVGFYLNGETPPPSLRRFAEYARLQREGFTPGRVPLEVSLEGLFLAIRAAAGPGDLEGGRGQRFWERWILLEAAIFEAARDGLDPFEQPVPVGETFARERAFLDADRNVYAADRSSGTSVPAMFSGDRRGSALFLEEPRSILFKQWSRRDISAPVGGQYHLLSVHRGKHWIISTDPVHRIELTPLHSRLQRLEFGHETETSNDPWVLLFSETLLASPRAGTHLMPKQIVGEVRRWLHAVPAGRSWRPVGIGLAGGLVLLMGMAGLLMRIRVPETAGHLESMGSVSREEAERIRIRGMDFPGYAILVCVERSAMGSLDGACREAAALYRVLTHRFGYGVDDVLVLADAPESLSLEPAGSSRSPVPAWSGCNDGQPVNGAPCPPTRGNVMKAISEIERRAKRFESGSKFPFIFYFAGHGDLLDRAKALGYLVLSGYAERGRDSPDNVGLEMKFLLTQLSDRIPASHQLLLLDSCYSGFATEARGPEELSPHLLRTWGDSARIAMTAGTSEQQTYQVAGRSIFTRAVLAGLSEVDGRVAADLDQDGLVTAEELMGYVSAHIHDGCPPAFDHSLNAEKCRRLVPQYRRGDYGDGKGQFLFIPRVRPSAGSTPASGGVAGERR